MGIITACVFALSISVLLLAFAYTVLEDAGFFEKMEQRKKGK